MARRATIIRQYRSRDGNLLVVDAGGFSLPFGRRARMRNEFIARSYALSGYHAVNLARNDLRLGAVFVRQLRERFGVPLLSTNLAYAETGEPIVATHVTVKVPLEKGTCTVAILGVLEECSALFSSSLKERPVAAKDPRSALTEELARLKGSYDLVILLAHMDETSATAFAEEVHRIDVLICGGDANRGVHQKSSGLICAKPGLDGKYLGVIEVDTSRRPPRLVNAQFFSLDASVPEEADVKRLVEEYHQRDPN